MSERDYELSEIGAKVTFFVVPISRVLSFLVGQRRDRASFRLRFTAFIFLADFDLPPNFPILEAVHSVLIGLS